MNALELSETVAAALLRTLAERDRLRDLNGELVEALRYVLTAHGEQLTDAFDVAHKVIAKATGEST